MPKVVKNIDNEILDLLSERNSIHIDELAKIFSYSLPIIRGICKKIAQQYNLSYIRGTLKFSDTSIGTKKRLIVQKAVSYISDGDTIFLGAGQTVLTICHLLQKFEKLTVITNSIPILNELLRYPHITTICVGGVLQHQDQALVGDFSEHFVKNFAINKIFIGTEGFDLIKGASRSIIQKNMAENLIHSLDGEIYVLMESNKFRNQCTWVWLPVTQIDYIITDNDMTKQEKNSIKISNNKLQIITV